MSAQLPQNRRPDIERDLLTQLAARWGRRAVIKQDELDLDGHYDPGLPDFPDHLVPVLALPGAGSVDDEARRQILAAAWICYNAKTAAVEDEVVLPACRLMLAERIPVRRDQSAVAALQQTIIDEHYHILMCHNAVGVTRRRRGLQELDFDPRGWSVVRGLDACRAGLAGPARDLTEIGFALAAETTISGYLSALSTAQDIQPMNRITTDLHRRDESGHAVIFRELACSLYRSLGQADRELFRNALAAGLAAFRAPDFDPWVPVARAGGFDIEARQLAELAAGKPAPARDTGPLQLLLRDLGISEDLIRPPAGQERS
ncbi:MAG TPA: diiron oxygenase [Streptosporangiaceae bacterium]